MKKTLIALLVLGTVAGVAQAQSSVTLYGTLDAGFTKKAGDTADTATKIGRGDNNKLGFRGVEDLGGGLAATFNAQIRFEPDTGALESGHGVPRPLFQGESTVGLKGAFGAVRLGRALSSLQFANGAFDPFGTVTVGAMSPFFLGGYSSDPLNAGSSGNRLSNAIFYNSPVMGGFAVNASAATKEALTSATVPTTNALSLAGTYNNGPVAAMLGYERNAINDKVAQVAAAYNVGVANLMASYSQAKFEATNLKTNSWMLGADVAAGTGNVLLAYGQQNPDGADNAEKKFSIGYRYPLSKRTYFYADAANLRHEISSTRENQFDLGIHHNF